MIDLTLLTQPILGEECRQIRKRAHLTTAEMGARAGVSRMAIYKFETGETQSLNIFREYYRLSKEG